MTLLRSLVMAISCFSQIPVPQVQWKPESMRYMMCFFPIIGMVIGLLLAGWAWLCAALGFGAILQAAGYALIPICVTGGIHMDGFADTCDALASNSEPERRREILKDPHTGAFAVIGVGMYLIADFALAVEMDAYAYLLLLAATPFFSRCLSGIATVFFAPGVGKGMLFDFHNSANRRGSFAVLIAMALACVIFLLAVNPLIGLCMVAAGLVCLAGLYVMSDRTFMGMSGDLAGFFLQVCELVLFACIVVIGTLIA